MASYNFVDPLAAQDNFEKTFNTEDPAQAASSYSKLMHAHTKKQLQTFTTERRRSSGASATASLSHETSNSSSRSNISPQ